ncbi:MAG: hypothetical protein RIC04_02760 [Parvibaculum sp.]|uniref:hypothetical protein n=1 Tax=Parvibaculum sp. TaxID=2024848 RepID=UPI0032EF363C
MGGETERHLIKTQQAEQLKFTYFLLASAGAAIAFALTQTHQQTLAGAHAFLGLALAMWALSFWCGCIYLRHVDVMLAANIERVRLQTRFFQQNPDRAAQMIDDVNVTFSNKKRAGIRASRWQYILLFAGALFFAAWRFMEMYSYVPAVAGLHTAGG